MNRKVLIVAWNVSGEAKAARLNDRQHYFATMRQAMRHVLIDYERHRQSIQAGGKLGRQPM